MPPHTLALKIGVIIMLLRNLTPKKGLCNGTRLIIKSMHNNFITAQIVSYCNSGKIDFIPRIDLAPSDVNLPFVLKRRQFPIISAYAMTIKKSQFQTFECVDVMVFMVNLPNILSKIIMFIFMWVCGQIIRRKRGLLRPFLFIIRQRFAEFDCFINYPNFFVLKNSCHLSIDYCDFNLCL
jgi:hypothetical protein